MRREIFSEEHELFRAQFRRFVEVEVAPNVVAWNRAGITPRSIWKRMGEEGYLGADQPAQYGGAGADFLYDAIVMEELAYARAHALQASLHTDICLPYLTSYGSEAQKQKYLVPGIAGDCLVAIAMTEPGTGSDLANVQTRAIREGDHYVVNGAKTFISNGQNCDLVIAVVKTDPSKRHDGISLILIDSSPPAVRSVTLAVGKCVPLHTAVNSCGLAASLCFMKLNEESEALPEPPPGPMDPIVTGFDAPRLKLYSSMCLSKPSRVDSPSMPSILRNASYATPTSSG
jgi:alkylation response protein AidB-like acyl-CoA dehydrogenase